MSIEVFPPLLIIGNFLSGAGINPTYSESLSIQFMQSGIDVETASSYLNPALRGLDMILSVIKAKRTPRVVIIDIYSGPKAFIYAWSISYLCRLMDLKHIAVLHGGDLPNMDAKRIRVLHKIILGASEVVAPSQYLARFFSELRKIKVIPNAINISSYTFRNPLQVRPNILFLRSFHQLTRPQDAILCTAILLSDFPEIKLSMAGWDEDGTLKDCQDLVDKLKLGDHVHFLGRLTKEEVYGISENNEIFLHTMLVDNTPISVLEAMATGLCIVATNVGGIPDLIRNGENGLTVSPQNPREMAEAIKRYLLDWEFARKLRENARKMVENYSWENVMPMWLNLLRSL